MARKTPTKQQRLNRQYREQIRRIERAYRSIEISGGRFSQTVSEIIRPVKKPTEATIRRLRSITKNDLYRKARTETGESGWRIRTQKLQMASLKGRITKHKTKLARELYGDYYDTYTEKEKKYAREEAYDRWRYDVDRRYNEIVQASQSIPDYEPSALPDNNYIEDITDRPTTFTDQFFKEESESLGETYESKPVNIDIPEAPEPKYYSYDDVPTGNDEAYYSAIDDQIENLLMENQDSQFLKQLLNEYNEMKERMSPSEFQKWLENNQEEFIATVEDVVKYAPSAYSTGEGLNKFTKAMEMMNNGVTPLEKFNQNYYNPDEAGYDEDYEDEEDEEDDEDEDGYVTLLDRTTGETIRGKKITYLQRVDKYGKEYYSSAWVDEYGMTLDVGYKQSHYVPISEIENLEDYF